MGIYWKGAREKAAVSEEAAEPALTGSGSGLDSESEADTPDGTAISTGEEASPGASGSSGAEWSGVERSGVERSGAEWSGVERSGAEWSGAED